jgi:signal transduction histidine kinase
MDRTRQQTLHGRAVSRRRFIPVLVVATLLGVPADAREPPDLHRWGSVTLFHGLPSDHVRAIVQATDNALWFGTDAGLVRYDGRRTQQVAAAGVAAGPILALAADRAGRIWVGGAAGAAVVVDGAVKPVPEVAGTAVTAVLADAADHALLTTSEGTLYRCALDGDEARAVRIVGPAESPLLARGDDTRSPLALTSLARAGEAVLVGTRGRGLLRLDGASLTEILGRPRPFFVDAVGSDASGNVWFGAEAANADSGLFECEDLARPRAVGSALGSVTALAFGEANDVWVGTAERGACRIRGTSPVERFTFESTAGGLRSDAVYSVCVDREGVVWFGTDRGVCRFDPHGMRTDDVASDPEGNFVRALFRDEDGSMWCGTNRGLSVRWPDAGGWARAEELGDRTVYWLGADPAGRLVACTSAGLFARTALPRDARFTRIDAPADASGPDSVRFACVSGDSMYVAVFGRGLERVDGERRTLVWPPASADATARDIVSVSVLDEDRLAIGTADGRVFVFDGGDARRLEGLDDLAGSAVWAVAREPGAGIWYGTSAGLYFHREGRLEGVLPGVDVRAVSVASSGAVWCATSGGGLYKVLRRADGTVVVSRFGTEHGLPTESVFAIVVEAGTDAERLWIGTSRGVAVYDPARVPPSLSVTRVVGERAYGPGEIAAGLRLDYPQDGLVLDVAAIGSRTYPERFQYAFRVLDTANRVVVDRISRDPQLALDDLAPGRYRVEALAYTSDLAVSEPLAVTFDVGRAPFPTTTVALSILLALALGAVWWGSAQNRSLARVNAALTAANRQLAETRLQLATETEAERRRIARDLHDQTLSDLRRTLMLADELPSTPAVFRSEIEGIATEIRRICEDLSPSVLENVGLAAALEWALADAVAHLPEGERFAYEFHADADVEEGKLETHIQIYRILQEAISNVCRHAAARRVQLSARREEGGTLVVTLEDDGRGFDARDRGEGTGRGLGNIRSRASLIDAEASWRPREGGGTVFVLRVGA